MSRLMQPISYRGRLVALAGRTGCHVLAVDLGRDDLRLVLLMCVYMRRAVEQGGAQRDLMQRAETWAIAVARVLDGGAPVNTPRSD